MDIRGHEIKTILDQGETIKIRATPMMLCGPTAPQAYRLLHRLLERGKIGKQGERRHAFYTRES